MISISKILTLNKHHILDKIESGRAGPNKVDYFTLGNPIIDPPRVRGSILLHLNRQFLTDNRNCFVYGSPIDVGSLKFGFFKPVGNIEDFIKNVTCDYNKFNNLLSELEKLPTSVIYRLMAHKKTPEARPILLKFFDKNVVDFMFSCDDPHAWMLEFSIQGPYSLTDKHVKNIMYPNTYAGASFFGSLNRKFRGKLSEYNPKYGIEAQWN